VGLIARALELDGIPAALTSWNMGMTHRTLPPRAVYTRLQRGATLGTPHDPEQQRRVLRATLALLERPAPLDPLRMNERTKEI